MMGLAVLVREDGRWVVVQRAGTWLIQVPGWRRE